MTSWQDHVKKFREKYPDLSFKEALIGASKTYKKNTTKTKHNKTRKKKEITVKPKEITIKPQKNERLIY